MNEEEKLNKSPLILTIDKDEEMLENTNFSLQELYNALTYIFHFKKELQSYIYDLFRSNTN